MISGTEARERTDTSSHRPGIARRAGTMTAVTVAGMVLAGAAALGLSGWRGADRWMRSGGPSAFPLPGEYGLSAEDVAFMSRDGTPLAGWFVAGRRGATAAPGTVVLLHGLHDTRHQMLEHAAYLHRAGHHVLLFDFRGTGGSGGRETFGAREQLDTLAAIDYLQARGDVDMRRVGVQGFSIGAVVALTAAAQDARVAAVVAMAPFADLPGLIGKAYEHRPRPLRSLQATATVWMLGQRLGIEPHNVSAVRAASRLGGRPLLVLAEQFDQAVPQTSAQAIYAASGEPKALHVVQGAQHGEGHRVQPEEFEHWVLDFWSTTFNE